MSNNCPHCLCYTEYDEACCLCADGISCYREEDLDGDAGEEAYRSDMRDAGRGDLVR